MKSIALSLITAAIAHGPTLNHDILKTEMFGKMYCEIGETGSNGISILADGTAFYFGPTLGAPNPATYFHVIASFSTIHDVEAPFAIGEFAKVDNTPIGQETAYVLHRSVDVIVSGDYQFSPKACL